MSNQVTSERNKTLLIVEGHHEKNKFFSFLFWCFREFNISMENVWVYGTNIYQLYDDIVKEYGKGWFENHDDIDLPFVVSKKKGMPELQYKTSFTNIIIVFDYERHDPAFSEKKIKEMQEAFIDPADMGKVYINYPMMEAAYHLKSIPDEKYSSRSCNAAIKNGKEYKNLVKQASCIKWEFELPNKIEDVLYANCKLDDELSRDECCKKILELSDNHVNADVIDDILSEYLDKYDSSLAFQFADWIKKSKHYGQNTGYRQYMRRLFQIIAGINIKKALFIQTGKEVTETDKYSDLFFEIDFQDVLNKQNEYSREKGLIWVLCTAILFIADYNTKLLTEA